MPARPAESNQFTAPSVPAWSTGRAARAAEVPMDPEVPNGPSLRARPVRRSGWAMPPRAVGTVGGMDGSIETFRVVTRPGPDAESENARGVFASLLGGEPVTTSSVVLPPGTGRGSHPHTAPVAAGVVSGTVTFVFGADGTGRVELGPGDYVWISAGVVHDEETSDGVELVVAQLEPFETLAIG